MPTCYDLSVMKSPATGLLARLNDEHAARVARAQPLVREVRSRLSTESRALVERFGARRVWLFGSFARGNPTDRSDVDIAVEGIAARDHFRAMAALARSLRRTVDLIRIEDLDSEDRDRLLRDAEEL